MPRVNSRLVPDGIYFGIDNGSSGLRAAYIAVEDGDASAEPVAIENNHRNGAQLLRMEAGDFDVAVPIDGDRDKPYYYGEEEKDPGRPYARLKYLIPVLALDDKQIKMADELDARFPDGLDEELAARLSLPPQCLPVMKLRRTMRVRWKTYLEDVAVAAFRYLKQYLDTALSQSKVVSHRHLPVNRYHLTIPDQWEGNPQRAVYLRIFTKAFAVDDDKVQFCLESEAQHMYYHADESLRAKFRSATRDASRCCFVLSNDFGGMSYNSALYTAFRNTDDTLRYCRVTDPVGVSGGSEEWEFHIARLATRAIMKKLKGVEVDAESLQDMLDQFNVEKKKMRPDTYGDKEWSYNIALHRPDNLGGIERTWETFQLSSARATQQFEKSMKGPFECFENQLSDAVARSKQSGFPLFVLVHGGMTRNKLFVDRLNKVASRLGLVYIKGHLIFTATFSGSRHRSCHLAMGASQLAVDSQTFEDFVGGGAAWGLQVRQHCDNPSGQWNNVAAYIPFKKKHQFHNPGRKPQKFVDVMAQDGLKLVVDPLYNVKHPPADAYINSPAEHNNNQGDMLDPRSCCYDLYTFTNLPPEDVWFRLRLSSQEGPTPDTATLVVEKSRWRWGADGERGRYGPFQMWLTMRICYDSGSRLWLPEEGSRIVERKISRGTEGKPSAPAKPKRGRPSKRKAKGACNPDCASGPPPKRHRNSELPRESSSEPEDESTPQQEPQGRKTMRSALGPVRFGPASRPPPMPPGASGPPVAKPQSPRQPGQYRLTMPDFDGPGLACFFSSSDDEVGY
ncbi:hypothetical protein QBC34DRAFT_474691 [Podospora aff. communis PSN243]|uniref:Uncharacterized protein n=1 Tax=Podospora aff. communis PSN243 TaxID=3040156 RepID=A0AAV9G806_9PEZI|nr:hypothetical protein QBC34DRAFT_474691 [Podospora aff. communis PSN243]